VFLVFLGVSLGARRSNDGCEISGKIHLGHTPMKESVSISANLLRESLLGRDKESVGAAEFCCVCGFIECAFGLFVGVLTPSSMQREIGFCAGKGGWCSCSGIPITELLGL